MNSSHLLELCKPSDTVSALAWSPVPQQAGDTRIHLLAASTWDGKLLYSRVGLNGQFENAEAAAHQAPVLDVAWALDGSKVFSASCDGTVQAWDFGGNQATQVAAVRKGGWIALSDHGMGYLEPNSLEKAHDQPVKFVRHVETVGGALLATGGWDGVMKWWDGRSPQPTAGFDLGAPAHCASFVGRLGVVCTNHSVALFDLAKQAEPIHTFKPFIANQWAIRDVCVFEQANSFAFSTIEGRVQIYAVNLDATSLEQLMPTDVHQSYSFRCHREAKTPPLVHSVNCVTAHKGHIFTTAATDRTIWWWDKQKKAHTKTKCHSNLPAPVTATAFSPDGNLLAYATGYDWHKGIEYQNSYPGNSIFVHEVTQNDVVV